MIRYFAVAGFRFSVETVAKDIDYPSFLPFEAAAGAVDFAVRQVAQPSPTEGFERVGQWQWFESQCFLSRRGDQFIWSRRDDATGEVEQIIWSGYAPTEFWFHSSMRRHVVELLLLVAFNYATLPHDTLIMHSSVVEADGAGYLFLGESGTGKSTHTKLWLSNITGARLLNDDGPAVSISGDAAVVSGTPWSGKGCVYRNETLPVAGLYRLSQAPENKLVKLTGRQAFAAILHSAMPSFMVVEEHADMAMETLSALVTLAPHFHLECLPNAAAARLSYSQVTD